MYKVFVNEKQMSFAENADIDEKFLHFEDAHTFDIAVDQLENTSRSSLAVVSHDVEGMWSDFRKHYKNIEAAGGLVENSEGKFLFIHRLGKWDLPKGKLEKNETVPDAAVREVSEETALSGVGLEKFISTTYHTYRERDGKLILKITHWFKMKYSGMDLPQPQTEEGITEVRWMTRGEIQDVVVGKTFRNIELVLREAGVF
ncbi:ADP-ribose pyrophosphatase YjhB, NUDIX family [Cruoricaptor ignavus]|uniref:ADP-ribose pyrophosphatase YjhB, NUDIX family n=2 Tax=Cruoricaptor ignavus TaxID=1118202 RepID=A0A1M6BM86_9FLAO|nr:NUDIX domain-containing protein [Cruoricaptor ignavus]QOR74185.1 NUDIX domain-containing protein [Cruoricaptor ignavus]SHI49777.1 ADP-ribose pyrophosphatase YjhB, NUDIX family [Cruoricaptor ignavus]